MTSILKRLSGVICLCVTVVLLLTVQRSHGQTGPQTGDAEKSVTAGRVSDQFVSIDFNNVDINLFIKFISELTGKNFVVDPRVKGKVTIISPAKISTQEAYKVFESVLEVHGFAAVAAGDVIKILPSPDARSKNMETRLRAEAQSPEDRIVTQLIPLKYADANEIKRLFAPFISKSSVILSYDPTNTLIITDIQSNIMRLNRILKTIDVAGTGQEISVIALQNADATKLVSILGTVFQPSKAPRKGATPDTIKFVADERTNTIVLLASEVDTARIRKLITTLDQQTPQDKGKIRVYYLENAIAEDLAQVLQEIPQKSAGTTAEKGAKKSAPVLSDKVRISADKATNSLIIVADNEDYQVIEDIIKKLDIPRAMVYIESLLMEVNVTKNFNIGVDWSALGEISYKGEDGVFGGGFGSGGGFDPTQLANPTGLVLGVVTGQIEVQTALGTVTFPNIGAIAKAFKTDRDVQILSTPQILTTDNEEAQIVIADNIPFQTTATTTASSDTFNSFEYRDVGKILKITPHISKDRLVRLNISLEVSNVTGESLQPTTSRRTVDTTVIVRDNHTVVIGGLIDDVMDSTNNSVPCLGEIPLIKRFFSSFSERKIKTNLYVFLTPRVIKSPAEANEVYRFKRDSIDHVMEKGFEEEPIKMYEDYRKDTPALPENLPDKAP